MQFIIGVSIGILIMALVFRSTEDGVLKCEREKSYWQGYEDAEMKYKKAVKPVILAENTVDVDFECPCCGRHTVSEWEHRPQYCADCGCKIDWEDKINYGKD